MEVSRGGHWWVREIFFGQKSLKPSVDRRCTHLIRALGDEVEGSQARASPVERWIELLWSSDRQRRKRDRHEGSEGECATIIQARRDAMTAPQSAAAGDDPYELALVREKKEAPRRGKPRLAW